MTCYQLILSDLDRISESKSIFAILRYLITNASFKITFWFRIGSSLLEKIKMGGGKSLVISHLRNYTLDT
ncbi:hypothetical protein FACS1894182_06450 [Bacteroidia bacterium]|nr:hypothetical protein FACS1894182_06450 [Bacteroidia bacterium]